ncbi:SHOCT domain-containing protein [Paenibacillus ferrarius]|uniref:SHOCT domain-containing protein n=1 Tax=Paenibacillus ferrarius TaxID=1469647 RepID=UPI003D27D4E7
MVIRVDDKSPLVIEKENPILPKKRKVMGIFTVLAVIFFILAFTLWVISILNPGEFSFWYGTVSFFFAFVLLKFATTEEADINSSIAAELEESLDNYLSKNNGFTCSHKLVVGSYDSVIAIDEINNNFYIFDDEIRLATFNDIVEVEVIEDEVQVTKTQRGGQVGGAIIGGVLAGGVGAVIGGLSSSKTTTSKVNKIFLKIIINDTKRPVLTVYFLNEKEALDRSHKNVVKALELIDHWYSLFSILIKRSEELPKIESNVTQLSEESTRRDSVVKQDSGEVISIADELIKLSELMIKGIITEEEFNVQKKKLLA